MVMGRVTFFLTLSFIIGKKSHNSLKIILHANVNYLELDLTKETNQRHSDEVITLLTVCNSKLCIEKGQGLIFGNGGGDCVGLAWEISGDLNSFWYTRERRYVIQVRLGLCADCSRMEGYQGWWF